ncbi:MAG: prephenate dehydratase [Actinomycetes bacterium]
MTVAYLGPAGSISHRALVAGAGGVLAGDLADGPDGVPLATITEVLDAVEAGEVAAGVVPVEDSVEGAVRETVDHLAFRAVRSAVHDQVVVDVDLRLLVPPGTSLADVTAVASHPHALAQCRASLVALGLTATVPTPSSSSACQLVAEGSRPGLAALATPEAGEAAGLVALPDDEAHIAPSSTAFAVVRTGPLRHHDRGRVLLFAVPTRNRPGVLQSLLSPFSVRGINLTRLESRPLASVLGEYGFTVELDGGLRDPVFVEALEELTADRTALKLLGAYPVVDRGWGTVHLRELVGRVASDPAELDALLGEVEA